MGDGLGRCRISGCIVGPWATYSLPGAFLVVFPSCSFCQNLRFQSNLQQAPYILHANDISFSFSLKVQWSEIDRGLGLIVDIMAKDGVVAPVRFTSSCAPYMMALLTARLSPTSSAQNHKPLDDFFRRTVI